MLIYIDLETTGLEPEDRICSIGLIGVEGEAETVRCDLVRPPRKIRPEAMALHHITNEMVREKPAFPESGSAHWLQEHNRPEHVLVGHNIAFDLGMLQKEGFVWQGGVVDTLKCTRHLIPECDQYGLQYLRYELGLYRDETAEAERLGIDLHAHNALGDAYQVKRLYDCLAGMADSERMLEMTVEPSLVTKFTFGKYKGRYIEEIALNDRGYLEWMLNGMFDMDEDLRYSVEYYLRSV
jgi:DNA polymerase-3 subunit epsilon/exodeoxyribonuclease X